MSNVLVEVGYDFVKYDNVIFVYKELLFVIFELLKYNFCKYLYF